MKKSLVFLGICTSLISGYSQNLISTNYYSTAFLNNKGELFVTGRNAEIGLSNTLGAGSGANIITTPTKVNFLNDDKIQEVSASSTSFQLALNCNGNVYAWGLNEAGEVGLNPQTTDLILTTPTLIKAGETGATNENLSNVTAIRAGFVQSFALLQDKKVVAWGKNIDGGLGNGTLVNSFTPKYVRTTADSILTNVIQIETGSGISLALVDDDNDGLGTVYIWGKNTPYSQLISRTVNLNYARPMLDALGNKITDIRQISIGEANAMLLDKDNNVWIWGKSAFLGNNQGNNSTNLGIYPTKVLDVSGSGYLKASEIFSGTAFSVAKTLDNTLVSWGLDNNEAGNLGTSTPALNDLPKYPTYANGKKLTNISQVFVGGGNAFVIDSIGKVYCWGGNMSGQLGLGNTNVARNATSNAVVSGYEIADKKPLYIHINQNIPKLCIRENVELSVSDSYLSSPSYALNWDYIGLISLSSNTKKSILVENPGIYNATASYIGTNKICPQTDYYPVKASLDLQSVIRGFTIYDPTFYCGPTAEVTIINEAPVIWYEASQIAIDTTNNNESLLYAVNRQSVSDFKLYLTEKPIRFNLNSFTGTSPIDLTSNASISQDSKNFATKLIVYQDVELKSCSFTYEKGNSATTFLSKVNVYNNKTDGCNSSGEPNQLLLQSSSFSFTPVVRNFSNPQDLAYKSQKVDFSLSLKGSPEGTTYWISIENLINLSYKFYYSPLNTDLQLTFSKDGGDLITLIGQNEFCQLKNKRSMLYDLEFTTINSCKPIECSVIKDCPTAVISTPSNNSIKIFPNPVSNTLNISGVSDKAIIELHTVTGVFLSTISRDNANLSTLATGSYLLKIIDGDTVTSSVFYKD